MQAVIQSYSEVFDEPKSLPPSREIDHIISLKEGIEAINVRPYRYAYFQKAEIEKQVQENVGCRVNSIKYQPFLFTCVTCEEKGWNITDY